MRKFRYILAFMALCLVVGPAVAQEVFKNDELTITKLEANMWVVETFDNTCMYIIEGDKKSMLIDTGTRAAKLDEVVKKITAKPLEVVLTHAHPDHAGNIHFFPEIWLHAADTVLLQKTYKGKVRFMHDGQIFDLGGTKIEVVHGPAHTPGSVMLIDRDNGNCYSGDAVGSGQVWLQLKPSSPMKTYIETCKKLEKLMDNGISKVYCGHYPHVKGALDKSYVTAMRLLAEEIDNGTVQGAEPFPTRIPGLGGDNPMIVRKGQVAIVYDPAFIK